MNNEYNQQGLHITWYCGHFMSLPDLFQLYLAYGLPCPLNTNIQALICLVGIGCYKEEGGKN
jgi:hypothetical protein